MKLYPFLKKNLEAMEANGHASYMWLSQSSFDENALHEKLFVNKHGQMDWRVSDEVGGMFETAPPQAFYQKWIPKEHPDTSATIVVGCNLGYGLNHVLVNTPDSHKVIVFEPNPELVLACLGQTDYSPFFAIKKLHFAVPTDQYLDTVIRNLDLQFLHGKIYLRPDIPSQQMGPEYAQWIRKCRDGLENYTVELTTLRMKQDVMVGNELKNFQKVLLDGGIAPLEGSAHGLAGVILGAGPSLADIGPELAANQGYALYTTAMQSLPAVQRVGLKPHLCLAIDYDPSMLNIYDRLDLEWAKDIPLIYSTKLNPEVVRRYPGPTIPMWTLGGLATFTMSEKEPVMDAGGNVSLTLLRFLKWCGVSQIVLAGQDFAWKENTTHASGHHAAKLDTKFNPKMHVRLKNMHGEDIVTSVQYLTSMREMERDIKELGLPVYNLYGGGAVIKGAKAMELDQAYMAGVLASVPGSRDAFMAALEQASTPRPRPVFEARSHNWATSLRNADKRMGKLFKKLGRNQNEIHGLMEQVLQFIKQDPLYTPYLFNEIMDFSGLAKARQHYEMKDLAEYRALARRILKKVREMDRLLGATETTPANAA